MKAPRLLIGLLAAATLIQTAGASGAFVTGSGDSSPASGIFQSSGAGAAASPLAPGRSAVKARLITAQTAAVPGKSLKLAVELTHDAGWHTYWKNPGDVGSPTEFQWTVPSGWKVTGPAWPEPTETQALSLTNYGISLHGFCPSERLRHSSRPSARFLGRLQGAVRAGGRNAGNKDPGRIICRRVTRGTSD